MSEELLVVLPVIAQATTDVCLRSVLQPNSAAGLEASEILVVDNSRDGWAEGRYGLRTYRDPDGHNLGVARAWNVGALEVLDRGQDYLVLMSASMMFGPELHTTWRRQMHTFWGSDLIECEGNSWHLIAIHRRLFEQVGLFDGNFYPGYWEADDFMFRASQTGVVHWPRAWVNALSQGSGLTIGLGGQVSCPAKPLLRYWHTKWGGPKGEEKWVLPFNGKPLDYWEDLPIPLMAERYGLEVWW